MIRRLLVFTSALLLFLCLAACGLWLRSYRTEDYLDLDSPLHHLALWSRDGRLSIWTDQYERPASPGPRFASTPAETPRWPDGNAGLLGFVFDQGSVKASRFAAIAVPWWSIALVSGIAGASPYLYRLRIKRRQSRGLCPVCGYDLRASKDRCPECAYLIPARIEVIA